MSDKNDVERKHHKSKSVVTKYLTSCITYLVIMLAVTVAAVFILLTPVTNVVHKAEDAAPMNVGDIEISSDAQMTAFDVKTSNIGDYAADIECEKRGLSCRAYLGLNRASSRRGAGISMPGSFFTEDGATVVAGCDETYFAALKYIEKGDVLTVTTTQGTLTYKVKDAYYKNGTPDTDNVGGDLMMYSSFSAFSQNADKCYYVIADKVHGEGK